MFSIRILAAFLLFGFPVGATAQLAPATDSLFALLDEADIEDRIHILHQLSDQYQRSDVDSALYYARHALYLSTQIDNEPLQAESHRKLGRLLSTNSRNPEAIPHLIKAKKMYELLGNLDREATTFGNLGSLYLRQSDYQRALEYYFSALQLWQQLDDQSGLASAYYNVGLIYEQMEHPEQAVKFYSNALAIYEDQHDYSGIAINATSLGSVYASMGNAEQARKAVEKGLAATKKLPGEHAKATILLELSSIYKNEKFYLQALDANTKALALARQMPDKILEALALKNIALIYRDQNHFKNSNDRLMQLIPLLNQTGMSNQLIQTWILIAQNFFDMEQWDRSIIYATRAYNRAEQIEAYEEGLEALKILTVTYEQQGAYHEAVRAHKAISVIKDSLYSRERARQIAELQTRYETEQKEQEIEQLQVEQEKANLIQNLFMVGLVLIALIGFLVYNRQRMKIKKNRAELERNHLQEKQLQHKIESKNRQLTTHTLNLVQKNEIMKKLKKKIRLIQQEPRGKIQHKLRNLENLVDYSFNLDKDWEEFRLYFEEIHTGFFETLKTRYPDLTPNELRLSALVKLNLTIKEIATIMGISPDSVKTARYRLRKKLEMETEENLTEFMMKLEKK